MTKKFTKPDTSWHTSGDGVPFAARAHHDKRSSRSKAALPARRERRETTTLFLSGPCLCFQRAKLFLELPLPPAHFRLVMSSATRVEFALHPPSRMTIIRQGKL